MLDLLWRNWRAIVLLFIVGGAAAAAAISTYCLSQQNSSHVAFIWLLGLGAFVASIAALFGDEARKWAWRPVLTATYIHNSDHCEPTEFGNGVQCYYFSMLITNDGARSATNVEVFVRDLFRRADNGTWEHVRRYALNLKWRFTGTRSLDILAPRMDRYCNIGHIVNPAMRNHPALVNESLPNADENTTIFALDLEANPNSLIHLLTPGIYRLTLQIVAANHAPVPRDLEITLTGTWIADGLIPMLREGISIRFSDEDVVL